MSVGKGFMLVALLLCPAAARAGDAAPGLAWKRHGVVLDLGSQGSLDERGLESPTVIREAPDRLVMWYRGRTFADDEGRILRAVSRDGIHWQGTGVVMEPSGTLEKAKIDPMTVLRDDGGYRMWFGGAGKGGCALLASSEDGIAWTRSEANPVLQKGRRDWDNRGAGGQHSVFRVGDRLEMIYKGYGSDRDGWTYYGLATSKDGERWKKKGRRITPDPDLGETTLFRNLFAFHRDGRYFVVHAMSGRDRLNLRLLRSEDAKRWERLGVFFAKGQTPGGTDVKWATSPSILFEDGQLRMWYEGGDAKGKVRLLYAEASEADFLAWAVGGEGAGERLAVSP